MCEKFHYMCELVHWMCEFFLFILEYKMEHPWKVLIEQIRERWWTQKQFSTFVWKKNSEVNELIKWKRNITVQRDLILADVLWTPEKYWINMQVEYDYILAKEKYEEEKNKKIISPEIVDKNWNQYWNNENNTEETQQKVLQQLPEKIDDISETKTEKPVEDWSVQQNDEEEKRKQEFLEKRRYLKNIWRDF